MTDIKWPELIYEQRLIAGTASLVNPEVNLNLPDKKTKKPIACKGKRIFNTYYIKDKIQLRNFFIVDGVVNIKIANGVSLNADHFFADIKVTPIFKRDIL